MSDHNGTTTMIRTNALGVPRIPDEINLALLHGAQQRS